MLNPLVTFITSFIYKISIKFKKHELAINEFFNSISTFLQSEQYWISYRRSKFQCQASTTVFERSKLSKMDDFIPKTVYYWQKMYICTIKSVLVVFSVMIFTKLITKIYKKSNLIQRKIAFTALFRKWLKVALRV